MDADVRWEEFIDDSLAFMAGDYLLLEAFSALAYEHDAKPGKPPLALGRKLENFRRAAAYAEAPPANVSEGIVSASKALSKSPWGDSKTLYRVYALYHSPLASLALNPSPDVDDSASATWLTYLVANALTGHLEDKNRQYFPEAYFRYIKSARPEPKHPVLLNSKKNLRLDLRLPVGYSTGKAGPRQKGALEAEQWLLGAYGAIVNHLATGKIGHEELAEDKTDNKEPAQGKIDSKDLWLAAYLAYQTMRTHGSSPNAREFHEAARAKRNDRNTQGDEALPLNLKPMAGLKTIAVDGETVPAPNWLETHSRCLERRALEAFFSWEIDKRNKNPDAGSPYDLDSYLEDAPTRIHILAGVKAGRVDTLDAMMLWKDLSPMGVPDSAFLTEFAKDLALFHGWIPLLDNPDEPVTQEIECRGDLRDFLDSTYGASAPPYMRFHNAEFLNDPVGFVQALPGFDAARSEDPSYRVALCGTYGQKGGYEEPTLGVVPVPEKWGCRLRLRVGNVGAAP